VRVRAIVSHFDEQWDTGLIVHDGEFGQYVNTPKQPERVGEWKNLQRGDVIEIEGRTVRGGFAPNIEPASVRKVGRAPLPTPKIIPFTSMLTGRHDCDYVEVNGVIQRAWFASDPTNRTLFADVAYEEGVLRATFWDYKPDDLAHLIDARVQLRGNVGHGSDPLLAREGLAWNSDQQRHSPLPCIRRPLEFCVMLPQTATPRDLAARYES